MVEKVLKVVGSLVGPAPATEAEWETGPMVGAQEVRPEGLVGLEEEPAGPVHSEEGLDW